MSRKGIYAFLAVLAAALLVAAPLAAAKEETVTLEITGMT